MNWNWNDPSLYGMTAQKEIGVPYTGIPFNWQNVQRFLPFQYGMQPFYPYGMHPFFTYGQYGTLPFYGQGMQQYAPPTTGYTTPFQTSYPWNVPLQGSYPWNVPLQGSYPWNTPLQGWQRPLCY